jgi:dTDP-4-amino-4,6-dideoxygalactose transaminase
VVSNASTHPVVDDDLQVPLLDLCPVHSPILSELKAVLNGVLESNRFIGGPEVDAFEAEVAEYVGAKHGVGVSSGTDALIVSMMAIGIGPGDEVIVPSFTFFATAGSVWRLGATPVFCDMDDSTFNLDPTELERLVTSKTKAVIPVHLFGQAADMDAIGTFCREHGVSTIEDAAQAIGADIGSQRVGSIGTTGCFSFFPSKNLGAIGDGGLVTTNDASLADRIRSLKDHGATQRYYHAEVGGNFRLDAIQAAALRVKLRKLEGWHEQRRANAAAYIAGFQELEDRGVLLLPREVSGRRHVFNQFVIRTPKRDDLQKYLGERKIGTAIYYPVPLHLQECFKKADQAPPSLPRTEQAAKEVLAIPVFPGLTEAQRDKVIGCMREFFAG